MPTYKALILNKEINVNYEEKEKEKLLEAIENVNSKLESYKYLNGKVSDNKLLSFLVIKLQAELIELESNKRKKINLEKKFNETSNKNIDLKDEVFKLKEENEILKKENDLINLEVDKIKSQIDLILDLVKKTYDD